MFRTRFRERNHTRDAPKSSRDKFGENENLRLRNFGSEISDPIRPSLLIAAHERHLAYFVEFSVKYQVLISRQSGNGCAGRSVVQGTYPNDPRRMKHSPRRHSLAKSRKSRKICKIPVWALFAQNRILGLPQR